jgi:hypothetical protein
MNRKKKALTFGDFIAGVYETYGRRKARGIVRDAVNGHLLVFRGNCRYVIS